MSEEQSQESDDPDQEVESPEEESQSHNLQKSLVVGQDLRVALQKFNQMQRELAEAARPIREIQDSMESATQPLRDVQQTMDAVTQPYAELQQTISAVQSARAIAEAYNQQWDAIREPLRDLREDIKDAVEEQITLEMPWEYDSVDPKPAAKSTADSWVEHFIEDLEDVEDEFFELMIERVEDGLEDFRNEPERPYAAIHIFISMQDALLWWLCYQDTEISTEATNEIGVPKYGTDEKQDALRKYYAAYFDVEDGDSGTFTDYKWDCFWAHRHAIMHGDLYATYDMNIATTAMLFFALTAHSVLQVIADKDEAGEDIPSIMDEIREANDEIEVEDVDAGEALGSFLSN